ncbi:MAG: HD-GYP domain-containing protein [Thermodesulfobacteriota bacterium]
MTELPAFPSSCLRHAPWCAANLTLHQFAESLGTAIDVKDDLTRTHSQEVAVLSQHIARVMGLTESRCEAIHIAGHLHDLGKIGIPDHILKKDGPLSKEEWHIMRQHPAMGYAILKPVQALTEGEKIADMVLAHHERFDGSGYPNGLVGEAIPLGARIIAVADAMSAMIGNRRYRREDPWEEAVAEIDRCRGSHFDPAVVRAFLAIQAEMRLLLRPTEPPPRALSTADQFVAA